MIDDGKRLDVRLRDIQILPMPVQLSEIKKSHDISEKLNRAVRMSMQYYLFEIEEDYKLISKLSSESLDD